MKVRFIYNKELKKIINVHYALFSTKNTRLPVFQIKIVDGTYLYLKTEHENVFIETHVKLIDGDKNSNFNSDNLNLNAFITFIKPLKIDSIIELSIDDNITFHAGNLDFIWPKDLRTINNTAPNFILQGILAEKSHEHYEQGQVLDPSIFRNHLKTALTAVSTDETQPHISSVLFDNDTLVSTDCHRLHKINTLVRDLNFTCTKQAMEIIYDLLSFANHKLFHVDHFKYDNDVSITHWEVQHKTLFSHIIHRYDKGNFPPYKQCIPTYCSSNRFKLFAPSFYVAVKDVHDYNTVQIKLNMAEYKEEKSKLTKKEIAKLNYPKTESYVIFEADRYSEVLKVNSEKHEVSHEIKLNGICGEPIKTSFNTKYLLEALEVFLKDDRFHSGLIINYDDNLSPIKIEHEHSSFEAIIMPARL